ncbi:MAG TPA: hypothetical protein VMW24_20885 [Sedimentisphaerales bacterium]|nr:hypothetical protein [Sedimentisphaerales bacterium]
MSKITNSPSQTINAERGISYDAHVWVSTGGQSKDPRDSVEYERRIENGLYKTIAQLRAMQLMRRVANSHMRPGRASG